MAGRPKHATAEARWHRSAKAKVLKAAGFGLAEDSAEWQLADAQYQAGKDAFMLKQCGCDICRFTSRPKRLTVDDLRAIGEAAQEPDDRLEADPEYPGRED